MSSKFFLFLLITSLFCLPTAEASNSIHMGSMQKFSCQENCQRGKEQIYFDLNREIVFEPNIQSVHLEQVPQRDFIFLNSIQHQKFSNKVADVQMFQSKQMDANLMRYSMYLPLKGQSINLNNRNDGGSTAYAIYSLAKNMHYFLR